MNNIEEFRGHEEIQHEIEGFHGGPTMEFGHFVECFDGSVYATSHVAVDSDNVVEEFLRQSAVSVEFDSTHEFVDCVEHFGLGELVDDGDVEGLIGFVVFAFGIKIQDSNGGRWV